MMDTKWTPEKWYFAGDMIVADCDHDGNIVCLAPETDFKSSDCWPMRARLIAAAPDLYKALEALVDAVTDVGRPCISWDCPELQAARAALAAARGEG